MKDIFSNKDFSSVPVFKDMDGKKGIVTGYFSEFNSLDSDGDVIEPGAFKKSILQNGPQSAKPRIKHLLNHDVTQPLGVLTMLKEDAKGLYYESKLGSHALAIDFFKMAESGLITEHSIGFRTLKYEQVTPWSDWREGDVARRLTELKLWEGSSLTAWGTNGNTPLTGIKGMSKEAMIGFYKQKSEHIEQFCRNTDATDETVEMLLMQNKQLTQLIIDLSQTTETAHEVTQPVLKDAFAEAVELYKFHNTLKN